MTRRAARWLAIAVAPVALPAAAAPPPARLPLTYAAVCPPPGDPGRITVFAAPKGVTVTFERPDLGRLDTRDVNLAFVSRRLFFKLRTATELIEFQGHAEDGRLEGLLSDERGPRRIAMPATSAGGVARCGAAP